MLSVRLIVSISAFCYLFLDAARYVCKNQTKYAQYEANPDRILVTDWALMHDVMSQSIKRFTISVYLSMRRSRRNGHQRRTCSLWARSMSIILRSSSWSDALYSSSPCGPATNELPQNSIPPVIPDGSVSCPTRLLPPLQSVGYGMSALHCCPCLALALLFCRFVRAFKAYGCGVD